MSILEAYPEQPIFAAFADFVSLERDVPGLKIVLTEETIGDLLEKSDRLSMISALVSARGKEFRAQIYEAGDRPRISLRSDSADFADFETGEAYRGFLADFLAGPTAPRRNDNVIRPKGGFGQPTF